MNDHAAGTENEDADPATTRGADSSTEADAAGADAGIAGPEGEEEWESLSSGQGEPLGEEDAQRPEQLGVSASVRLQRGCKHYRRGCRIVAPCCGEVFWCRLCHNEAKNSVTHGGMDMKELHEVDRFAIEEIVCDQCKSQQRVGSQCVNCSYNFGLYYCSRCRLWEDLAEQKGIFHCDDCGICRVGGRENYFHCEACHGCYSTALRNNHRCIARAMQNDCPVCLENLFSSTAAVSVLGCGHPIHQKCLNRLQMDGGLMALRCPLCNRTHVKGERVWKRFDEFLRQYPMDTKTYVRIYCHDCSIESVAIFHFHGLKCRRCGSYNTASQGSLAADDALVQADREERRRDRAAQSQVRFAPSETEESEYVTESEHEERH